MPSRIDIDALYRSFCACLPSELQETGRALACRLKLAPSADVPWSEVFKHQITLQAPALFVSPGPRVTHGSIEGGVLAHMLSIVEAFAVDRIADGQIPDD